MEWINWIVWLSGVYPLARAWWSNRHTTLTHALAWALAAWLSWAGILASESEGEVESAAAACYLTVSMMSCAGIAVLGARRPLAGPWNFVLLGLLAVLLLPLSENALLGTPLLDPLRLTFIIGTLAVGVLNYLPTNVGVPVALAAVACGLEMAKLMDAPTTYGGAAIVGAACWLGWLVVGMKPKARAEFDREWLGFRDRFGLMWGQRVREQFNQAARHAGWPVVLRWSGSRRTSRELPLSASDQTAIVDTLRALLSRFGV